MRKKKKKPVMMETNVKLERKGRQRISEREESREGRKSEILIDVAFTLCPNACSVYRQKRRDTHRCINVNVNAHYEIKRNINEYMQYLKAAGHHKEACTIRTTARKDKQ